MTTALLSVPELVSVRMRALMQELYPICRSITGNGLRQSLHILQQHLPLELHEVPTGTQVLDWTVPNEWNIRDASVANRQGERVIDFRRSTLHVVQYSVPVRQRMTLEELRPRLHTLPDRPAAVPYRTAYYREDWGFCLSQRALDALPEGVYDVHIDSTLAPGSLTYGECVLPGESGDEVLISSHCCHPALANDNLSGIALATALYDHLQSRRNRYTYRFLFAPVTIGAIAWLALNEEKARRIRHGLVLSGVGNAGSLTYKRTRHGNRAIDRAFAHVLGTSGRDHQVRDFTPYGYDERQYNAPGFDLPVACLMRAPHGEYGEYHTSDDGLDFVTDEALADSLALCIDVFELLERDVVLYNQSPKGEPQLGRRGLFQGLAGRSQLPGYELALFWVLNLSDGSYSLRDIAERAGLTSDVIEQAAAALRAAGLLAETPARLE